MIKEHRKDYTSTPGLLYSLSGRPSPSGIIDGSIVHALDQKLHGGSMWICSAISSWQGSPCLWLVIMINRYFLPLSLLIGHSFFLLIPALPSPHPLPLPAFPLPSFFLSDHYLFFNLLPGETTTNLSWHTGSHDLHPL